VRGGLPGNAIQRVTVDSAELPRELPDASPPASSDAPRRRRFPRLRRSVRFLLASLAVIVAVTLVTVFSIDLGPSLRGLAERRGAAYLKREFTIGALSARLYRGRFEVRDLAIGGLTPGDRPFFTAKRVTVQVPWWTIVSRNLVVESVELDDWHMLVEVYKGDRHNFPKFTRDGPAGPKRFVTTVRSVKASRGTFELQDYGAPWSVVAPNIEVTIRKEDTYRGTAGFDKGTIRIAKFEPMWGRMASRFKIDNGKIVLDRIDLVTDGAVTHAIGEVDMGRWPEQTYAVRSRIDFPRMKELFWARDHFTLAGTGEFQGTYHLFKGGRELTGRFASLDTRLNDWRFAGLEGSLVWTRDRFEVTRTRSGFYGGRMALDFSMKPLGDPKRPGVARLDTAYEGVDVAGLMEARQFAGLRLQGRATGHNVLSWPLGRFREHNGGGEIRVDAPARLQDRTLPVDPESVRVGGPGGEPLPQAFASLPRVINAKGFPETPRRRAAAFPLVFTTPIGGALRYEYGPEWVTIAPGWIATPSTYIELQGRTAYGEQSALNFHATSSDWQESDQWLTAAMTAFGNPTRPVAVGGAGHFDGVMLGAFKRPRVEGRFAGQHMKAWDVEWGSATADLVIQNAYVDIARAHIRRGESTMDIDGRFSLGFPRRDGGEEMNARVRMTGRPVDDLKHAFELDDYQVKGALSGEFRVYGRYQGPFGFGRMQIDDGVGYGEAFDTASAALRFEGTGVRLDGLDLRKSSGAVTGAAFVGWDGTYSFNADGRRVPVGSLAVAKFESLPLTGFLDFSASGSGTFDDPRYSARGRIVDLFVGEEGLGLVTGRLEVRGDVLSIAQLEAASPRLAASGAGRITLNPVRDADLTLRFSRTSIDPYVRILEPRLSPFTTAVASGGLRIVGPLRDTSRLGLQGVVEDVDFGLFDYHLKNDGPIRLALADDVARIERLKLVGEGTTLELAGEARLSEDRLRVRALGDANLGLLQGFFRDIRSSGSASVQAEVTGSSKEPIITGSAVVTNGRLRYFGLPHSIDGVNGRVEFDASGVRLDGLSGRMGSGEVRFGGRIGIRAGSLESYNLTAVGRDMRIRYPEGFRSQVDADLALRGPVGSPLLTGTVQVKDALFIKSVDTEGTGIFGLAASSGPSPVAPAAAPSGFPLRFDLKIEAPSALRIDSPTARLVSSADLTLRGTYDKPSLMGRADIERGEILLEGNRYLVTRGSIEFTNPARIDPFFDVEAETRARAPGQTYRVTFRASGTRERFAWDFSSDPPLSTVDILALLFGDLRDPRDAELSALRLRDRTEEELLMARATRLLANPISSEVGRVVRKTFGVDSVQITPSLGDLSNIQSSRLNPTARLTIGKRLSDRLFLTYAQPLTSSRPEQLLLIEYNQSDRFAWILSRNEDETYAIDVRVRHVFE
jgi:translocation-and-assembly-module (TAM) inner membrane subunit TamB-like protein